MSVAVGFPWRNTSAARLRGWQLVQSFYQENFPEWPRIWISLSPFSPAGARNAVAQYVGQGADPLVQADVLVFNDADSLCDPTQVELAAELAAAEPGLVFAFSTYARLTREATEQVMTWQEAFDAPIGWTHDASGSSGCIAISRACFLEVGGYDERFRGWGYEDLAFARACAQRWPLRRLPGALVHLWHPSDEGRWPELEAANKRLFETEYAE